MASVSSSPALSATDSTFASRPLLRDYKAPPSDYTWQTNDDSSRNSFLSAPELPCSENDIPFKPASPDQSSLRFKQRHGTSHHGTRRQSQAPRIRAAGHEPAVASPLDNVNLKLHSKSMPSLRAYSVSSAWRSVHWNAEEQLLDKVENAIRRWTLPSKASSTTAVAAFKPVIMQKDDDLDKAISGTSPAMITLRRSTNASSRQSKLTFFPPPSFSKGPVNFMSYFSHVDNGENHPGTNRAGSNRPRQQEYSRSASISFGSAQPTTVATAEPMLTEVQPNAYFTDGNFMHYVRRCSTKYVSGSSIYEVLWDGTDMSSDASLSSTMCVQPESNSVSNRIESQRRISLAVDQLEIQLAKPTGETQMVVGPGSGSPSPSPGRRPST